MEKYNIRNREGQGNITVIDDVVTQAPFFLKFLIGWKLKEVLAYVDNKGWKIRKVE